MSRPRTFLAYLKLSNSLLSTRSSATRPLPTQVTHFYPSPNPANSFNTTDLQKFYFSSKPSPVLELLLSNEWSSELESELQNSNPAWSHELVIYVLKRLDKEPKKAWAFFNWVSERDGFRPSSAMYGLLLRLLVKKDSMKNFWIAIRKMKEEGFCIDEQTYLTMLRVFKKENMSGDVVALTNFYGNMAKENGINEVVKNVVSVVMKEEPGEMFERGLEAMEVGVTDDLVIRVLKELRNYPSKALRFFHWINGYQGYRHNTITYNAVCRVVGKMDSLEEFWSVVEEMKSANHEMDMDTYVKISRSFQKHKLMEDAVKLYEFMMDSPFKPSVEECSILLRSIAASENPDLSMVVRVVEKYKETGGSLSKAVYDGIHRSLTSTGKFDEAAKIVTEMRSVGYEPDNITYSQLVFGLCKAKRLEEACTVLDEMKADGCIPDIKTWTILIQGHCSAGQLDKALMCLAKMIEKNTDADADLLDVLINGFINQNRVKGAYTLLVEMVNTNLLVPWQATYKCLIEKLLGVRKLEEALNLLLLMKKHNYPPHMKPFVQYISQYGTVEDAADFLSKLSVKGYPSSSAYFNIFDSFFKEGRYSEAKDLLFKCPHHIRQSSKITELFGSAKSIADNE